MRETFEIISFPDLSLPKYYDLFGEEALTVSATRLFSWFQMLSSSNQDFSFTLRYFFTPSEKQSNRRLRIFVIVTRSGKTTDISVSMGRKLSENVLSVSQVDISDDFKLVTKEAWNLAILGRRDYAIEESNEVFYLPAVWMRSATARTALEPYLDEAFASLDSPAFLDIQLYSADPNKARQSLRAATNNLERKKYGDSQFGEEYIHHYKSLYDSISIDPSCHLLILAGSKDSKNAQGLLQAFGVDTIGGGKFDVHLINQKTEQYKNLIKAFSNGVYEFSEDGWYNPNLSTIINDGKVSLSSPQIQILKGLSELSVMAGSNLIQDVLTLPIPRRGYLRTFPLETEINRSQSKVQPAYSEGLINLGEGLERKSAISIPVSDLSRHGFIAGVTGSGKTVTMFNILTQLAKQKIPFIVFEPAKSEYRGLARFSTLSDELRVYTPGRDDLNPIRINPFEFEPHITLSEHIANLVAAFNCALSLFNPLPSILEEAIWHLYESKGWSEDSFGDADFDLPRVNELPQAVNEIIDGLNYDSEITSNFKGAFRSRFNPFTRGSTRRLFECTRSSPSIKEICGMMSLVELQSLSQQQANLITMFTMISLREHLRDSKSEENKIRLALILEEAHNLVPAVPEQVSDGEEGNAKSEASRYISNMLAEMRALGLSILIVDQTPAAVSAQVLRNTNLKIAHRTVAKEDRETLADAMLMHPAQTELLGRLLPGQAYVYFDKYFRSLLVQNAFSEGDQPLSKTDKLEERAISDSELRKWLADRNWFKNSVQERIENINNQTQELVKDVEDFSSILTEFMNEIENLNQPELLEEKQKTKADALNYYDTKLKLIKFEQVSLDVEYRAVKSIQKASKNNKKRIDESQRILLSELITTIENLYEQIDSL